MTSSKDQFGSIANVGDSIVFSYSQQNGNTSLTKANIQSFTKSGNPRVRVIGWIYNRELRKSERGFKIKAVTGSWAKAYDNMGSEEYKTL